MAVWIPLGAMMARYDALKKAGVTDEERVAYLLWVQVRMWVYVLCEGEDRFENRNGSTGGWIRGHCHLVAQLWCWT